MPGLKELYEVEHNGRVIRGIILEPSEGTAIGVIRLTNEHTVRAVLGSTVARKSTDLESGNHKEVFAAAEARVTLNTGGVNPEDPKKAPAIMKRRLAPQGSCSSDDEWNLDVILGKTSVTAPSAKRQKTDAATGQEAAEKITKAGGKTSRTRRSSSQIPARQAKARR